jgi:hypothetical protein
MALNNVCLYCSFQIELVPILRCLLQHCIQVRRIGDDLGGRFGSFPQNAGQNNDWLTCDSVMESGDYGVGARETLSGNLPLKHPDSLGRALAIHDSASLRALVQQLLLEVLIGPTEKLLAEQQLRFSDGIDAMLRRVVETAYQPCLGVGSICEFGISCPDLAEVHIPLAKTLRDAIATRVQDAQQFGGLK